MNRFAVLFAYPHLYAQKPVLKERIRSYVLKSREVQMAIKRGAKGIKLLGGPHKSATDTDCHFTGQLEPLKLGKVHILAPSWSIPPDYLEEGVVRVEKGTAKVNTARGFGLKKQK
ncbi:hypothetical protein EIP86_009329 [Pleurotus ostreatoroseus]|nr:hypothetical protein EIP86_009329 [Pleurotus ostreatoroseus]